MDENPGVTLDEMDAAAVLVTDLSRLSDREEIDMFADKMKAIAEG